MSFNIERMRKVRFIPAQLNNAMTIHFILELDEKIVSRFIPAPLKLAAPARGHFALNHFRQTSLPGVDSYLESAILIEVEYEGIKGNLTLAMILDDDNAMIGGREFFGFPKKMGVIQLQQSDSSILGQVSRRDAVVAKFKCESDAEIENPTDVKSPFGDFSYNIKCFPDPSLRKLDYPPRLIRHKISEKLYGVSKLKNMELKLKSSPYDPWSEIEPFTIIEGYKREYDCTILAGEVIAELDSNEYFKYALNRFI